MRIIITYFTNSHTDKFHQKIDDLEPRCREDVTTFGIKYMNSVLFYTTNVYLKFVGLFL